MEAVRERIHRKYAADNTALDFDTTIRNGDITPIQTASRCYSANVELARSCENATPLFIFHHHSLDKVRIVLEQCGGWYSIPPLARDGSVTAPEDGMVYFRADASYGDRHLLDGDCVTLIFDTISLGLEELVMPAGGSYRYKRRELWYNLIMANRHDFYIWHAVHLRHLVPDLKLAIARHLGYFQGNNF